MVEDPKLNQIQQVINKQAEQEKTIERLDFEMFSGRIAWLMLTAESILYGELQIPPMGLISILGDGRILYTNRKLTELLGYDQYELVGKQYEDLVPENVREESTLFRADFIKHPYQRILGPRDNFIGLHKNGSQIPLTVIVSPTFREGRLVLNIQCAIIEK